MKPMLPSLVTEIPEGLDWVYEVKYDGFRAIIYIDETKVTIMSRNQNVLNEQFPEIVEGFIAYQKSLQAPIIFDGELCVIENDYKANFDKIQIRGRLKNSEKIEDAKKTTPVTFMAFDVLMENGEWLTHRPYEERKKRLEDTVKNIQEDKPFLRYVPYYKDPQKLWSKISQVFGEGIIAKRRQSLWQEGKRTNQWVKIKNLMIASFFILGYDEANSFFHIGCLYKGDIKLIGKVGQGFTKEEKEALVAIIKKNAEKTVQNLICVKPSICIEVEFLEVSKNELRHPKFRRFRFDKNWEECTWEAIPKLGQN
ncbi:non-homologous end-joining DNA ligase [Anaerobacillus alkaliphilus]|nr:non-homologous end-joining DNA ligase [Anaerobacillus alkaliphilus]